MTTRLSISFAALGAIWIHGGCSFEGGIDGEIIEPDAALLQPAAVVAGSSTTNNEELGLGRRGTEILGYDAQGTSRDGRRLTQLGLRGSAFVSAVVDSEQVLSGADLVGATFHTVTRALEPIEIRIDALKSQFGPASDKAVHRYTIAVNALEYDGWRYACGVDSSGDPIQAIPLDGLWDYRSGVPGGGSKLHAPGWITFACDGFALASCVDLGYLPWNLADGMSSSAHHLACTRAIRADYCGNGLSHAQDGMLIDVYDSSNFPPSLRFPGAFHLEAEWTDRGARCLRHNRGGPSIVDECGFEIPPKLCGTPPHWDQTLLISALR